MDADVVVVGAGVVGLACAVELSRARQVAVVERHGGLGDETSSHNSGVVHAAIYYPTGSLKHETCIEGNRLLYEWCASHGVRINGCGKLIIAVSEDELESLEDVARQAEANGVPGITRIDDAGRLREMEPAVRCVAALHSGTTGVVDQSALMASFATEAQSRGAWIALKHDVVAIERATAGFELTMAGPGGERTQVTCETLVNCAGLGAPAVASMLGYPLDGADGVPVLRQTVNKGRYYDIVTPEKARAIRRLIYPVPEHTKGGLGVHVTIDIDGGVHLGPDTEWLDDGAPLDYRADDVRRADFLLWHDRGYVHLGGIESPGLTASLSLARRMAALL
ncbi:MAG TPA: NAD(P)/FAD-dependent oxidoreductase [Dehalococcoidia bacterium]|nr:NAD(P)/FAD-dependent oxidoreductase [Dehalococcoidia bacterium]